MKSHLLGAISACFVVTSLFNAAHASSVFGVQTSVNTLSPCPSFCGGPTGSFDGSGDGGAGSVTASTTFSGVDGNGAAFADFSDINNYLPIMGVKAYSNAEGVGDDLTRSSEVSAWATGMHGYTYTGDVTITEGIDIALTGEMGGTTSFGDVELAARVMVVLGTGISDFMTGYSAFDEYVFYDDDGLGLVKLDSSYRGIQVMGSPQTVTDSLSFTLNPGDEFFVWSQLFAQGTRGGYADGYNTLTMSFVDGTNIIPTPSISGGIGEVPVPAAVWLFGSGLIGLIAVARRKKS